MLRLVLLQLAVTLVTGVIAGLVAGIHAMFSAFLGGLCCVIPNGLFALRLTLEAQKAQGISPTTFFVGEFLKIAMTIAMFGAVVWLYRDLSWLALIVGFVVALKSYIILLIRH